MNDHSSHLSEYKVLSFDCYGTLIDWESGILAALQPLRDRHDGTLADDEWLEMHARLESRQQKSTPTMPYSRILSVVYRRLSEFLGLSTDWDECERYGNSVGSWPIFPDTTDALRRLKETHALVILSNVDNRSFSRSNELLGIAFDAIYTAEDIGSYKPDMANFQYMLHTLSDTGVKNHQVLHVAESMFHDHVPARQVPLDNCWIHRRWERSGYGATMNPGNDADYNFRFTSMAEFADAVMDG